MQTAGDAHDGWGAIAAALLSGRFIFRQDPMHSAIFRPAGFSSTPAESPLTGVTMR